MRFYFLKRYGIAKKNVTKKEVALLVEEGRLSVKQNGRNNRTLAL
jgi:hypothetical protein